MAETSHSFLKPGEGSSRSLVRLRSLIATVWQLRNLPLNIFSAVEELESSSFSDSTVTIALSSQNGIQDDQAVILIGEEQLDSPQKQDGPLGGWSKRALDILIASMTLLLVAPLMIVTAFSIMLTMGWPIIYAHRRIGLNGKTFRCLKFRTMVNNSREVLEQHLKENPESAREWLQTRKLARDPRVQGMGDIFRRSSIDELPQLFNVLLGDMSCIGPRPIVAEEVERYGTNARVRLLARPGLTGLWQISGRNRLDYANRVKLDTIYVRRWSMLLDLRILIKTIPAVMKFDDTA